MKIIVDDKIPFIRGQVEQLADEVVYKPGAAIGPTDLRDTDAMIIRTRTHCNRELLEGSHVRLIVTATIGYDHIDTRCLKEAGITWTNCPGCNATSVAQYVRNSLLEAERKGLISLSEATLGIVGYGHVGKAVYEAMRPYMAEIVLCDPFLGLHNDVRHCDVITLHTPLTTDGPYPTHHLVDQSFLLSTDKHPIIINAARGGVVDEAALEQALDSGLIRQAIIDTWEGEPYISPSLLQKAFIATPHIAGYSADGKANATRMSLEAVARWEQKAGLRSGKTTFDIQPPEADIERTGLHYNPTSDSEALKRHPEQFEKLRGDYPLRRE